MAKNYNDIYTAVYTKGNKMDFTNSMIRGNGIPLDITDIYNSYAAAKNYVDSNPVAYEGQVLAVTENNDTTVYVIAPRLSADGTTIEHYLKPVGSVPDVDGKTIIINAKGQLEAVMPEYVDTNTTYTLTTKEVEEGTQLIFTSSDEEVEDVIVLVPKAYDDSALVEELKKKANSEDVYSIEETNDLLDEKANKATNLKDYGITDAYTKIETDTKIGEAIAAADHLKRKIIETIEYKDEDSSIVDIEKTILNSLSKDEAGNYIDVDKYIYMIPIGPVEDDNKYYEYIAIDISDNDIPEYLFEKVGSWEVNLDAYVTNDKLKDYALKSEIPTDYVTTTEIENYETAATAEGKYVAKEEGKSLIANTEIERLAKIDENAEVNYVKSVDENRFTVTEAGKLELNDLADYVKVTDATAENGLRFINQTEINKLNKLNLDGEDITISGSVNASQVKELYATVTNIVKGSTADLDPDTEGSQLGLGIQEGAQVNFIDNINTDVFSVDNDKKLDLLKIPVEKLDGLETWVEENRNAVTGLYPTTAVALLNNLDNTINNEETGLIAGLTAVKARVLTNENSIKGHADRLDTIEYAMTWHDI